MTDTGSLRAEVRTLLDRSSASLGTMCDAWMRGHDNDFTKMLGASHLIGMTWPVEFGGRQASNVDRLVVTEELLRVGAPVAAHWIADRQIGPAVLRYGSRELQERFLPAIAAGEVTFCLGMSETEAGSDLSAVRTKAVRDGQSFRLTGSKIWTSHAHRSTHIYVLARTDSTGLKHDGLTEFIVDLGSPGITVRPILDLAGEHHFNETFFDDVAVPAANIIGTEGGGWRQVTEQLAFERGGMERVLSTYPLLVAALRTNLAGVDPIGLGSLVGRLHTLRAMAHRIALAVDDGQAPARAAALLKFLGTTFERDVVEFVRGQLGVSPDPNAPGVEGMLGRSVLSVPGATIRGGTTEMLLTIVGRQELAATRPVDLSTATAELRNAVIDVLRSLDARGADDAAHPDMAWNALVELGWTGIGVPEASGGSGGTVADLAILVEELARAGRSAPVAQSALTARVLAAGDATLPVSAGPLSMALGGGLTAVRTASGVSLTGSVAKVPWGRNSEIVVLGAGNSSQEMLIAVPRETPGVRVEYGANLAGEPRDTMIFESVDLPASAIVGDTRTVRALYNANAVLQTAAILGALRGAHAEVCDYVRMREQFGTTLASFQAVAHNVARLAAEVAMVEQALVESLTELDAGGPGWRIVAGRSVAARAAGVGAALAHQLLGAMGMTQEHSLRRSTLALWSWRDETTPERVTDGELGAAVLAAGPDRTWDWCVHEVQELASAAGPWGTR